MNLYDVLLKKRGEMDYYTKKICSVIMQEAFWGNEILPNYIMIDNVVYNSKEKLNAVLKETGIVVTDINFSKEGICLSIKQDLSKIN